MLPKHVLERGIQHRRQLSQRMGGAFVRESQARKPCPRCGWHGPVTLSESKTWRSLAYCWSCELDFTNNEPYEFEPTGIEYLDRYLSICGEPTQDRWFRGPLEPFESFQLRDALVLEYSWAVPTPEAIDLIAGMSPIVEMGAGSGYWSYLLHERGADVKAFDHHVLSYVGKVVTGKNNRVHTKQWFPVKRGGPKKLRYVSPDHTLLLCWPPYDDPFASHCLSRFQGDRVVYIGEGEGGCTGDDRFHQQLRDGWEQTKEMFIPQWVGIHDWLLVYERRGA